MPVLESHCIKVADEITDVEVSFLQDLNILMHMRRTLNFESDLRYENFDYWSVRLVRITGYQNAELSIQVRL